MFNQVGDLASGLRKAQILSLTQVRLSEVKGAQLADMEIEGASA
jgi:hypothetical protein